MKRLFVLIVISISFSSAAQNALDEYKKIVNAYKDMNQFSFDVDVYAYENKSDKKAQPVGKGVARKKDGNFYSRFQETEMVQLPEITLLINHDKKQIQCYDAKPLTKKDDFQMDFTRLLDSMFTKQDSMLSYYGVKNGQKHFSFSTPGSVIERTDMYVNPVTNLISRIVYSYGESTEDYEIGVSSVIVYYRNIEKNVKTTDVFSIKKYVTKQGNDFSASSFYKGFKVIYYKRQKPS